MEANQERILKIEAIVQAIVDELKKHKLSVKECKDILFVVREVINKESRL